MTGPLTVKIGGAAGEQREALGVLAREAPPDTVIVHGGGSEVAAWSRRLGLEPTFVDGLRVTDAATLEVAVAVLAGLANTRLVAALAAHGRPAVGLTGADGGLLGIRPLGEPWGLVAEVVRVDPRPLDSLLSQAMTPVVAPIGGDASGTLHNINADEVAGAIAAARGGRLLLFTDVTGVLRGGETVDELSREEAEALLNDGEAVAGMRPKLRAALRASTAGCDVAIADGRSAAAVADALAARASGTRVAGDAGGGT